MHNIEKKQEHLIEVEMQYKECAAAIKGKLKNILIAWNSFNRTVRERTKLKGLSASLTVTLRIHWTTAIYMADAALTW